MTTSGGREWWTQALSDTFCEMDPQWHTSRGRFRAKLTDRDFGGLRLSTMRADGHAVVRTPGMIGDADRGDFFVCAVTGGPGTVSQHGRSVVLDRGDLAMIDSGHPYRIEFPGEFAQTVVCIPRSAMEARMRAEDLDSAVSQRISGTGGAGAVIGRLVNDVATYGEDVNAPDAAALAESVMDMIGVALTSAVVPRSVVVRAHVDDYRRAQTFIRARLGDRSLTVGSAATELGMSVRYLQKLFAADGTTPRDWLLRARLERARTLLLSSDITIAELAGEVGFKETSHFSRSFALAYGRSPGRYRRERPRIT